MKRPTAVKVWEKCVDIETSFIGVPRSYLTIATISEGVRDYGVVVPLPEPSPHLDHSMQEAIDLMDFAQIATEHKCDMHYRADLKLVFS